MWLFCESAHMYVCTLSGLWWYSPSWAFGCPDIWACLETGCKCLALKWAIGGSYAARSQWGSHLCLGIAFKLRLSSSVPSCRCLAPGRAPCWSGPWSWLSFPAWQPWTCLITEDMSGRLCCCHRTCPALLAQVPWEGALVREGPAVSALLSPSAPWHTNMHTLTYLQKVTFLRCSSVHLLLICFATQAIVGKLLWDTDLPVLTS